MKPVVTTTVAWVIGSACFVPSVADQERLAIGARSSEKSTARRSPTFSRYETSDWLRDVNRSALTDSVEKAFAGTLPPGSPPIKSSID